MVNKLKQVGKPDTSWHLTHGKRVKEAKGEEGSEAYAGVFPEKKPLPIAWVCFLGDDFLLFLQR